MKRLLTLATIGAAALAFNASAHGPDKAQHGGVVQGGGDLSFELVAEPGGASIYVVDHGKPADVSKMSGKLTVLNGADKSEAELKPAAPNKLEAKDVKLASGAKAVATVTTATNKVVTVRFVAK